MRTRMLSGVGSLAAGLSLVLAGAATAPASAASEGTDYQPIGLRITGGADVGSATELEVGDSLDSLGAPGGANEQRWYRYERQYPGSTVHIAAAIPLLAADPWASDEIELTAYAGSDECGSSQRSSSLRQGRLLTAYLPVPGSQASREECADAGAFTFSVTRGSSGLDLEAPLELRVIEEPGPIDSAKLAQLDEVEPAALDLSSPGEEVTGGRSLVEATELEPGVYRGRITPGETQIFALPLSWGQHLSAAVEFPPPNAALAAELEDAQRLVALNLYAPTRAPVATGSSSPKNDTVSGGGGATLRAHTLPLAWANRTSSSIEVASASLAGEHYVVLAMAPSSEGESDAEMPFTIGVAVGGEERGVPDYEAGEKLLGEDSGQGVLDRLGTGRGLTTVLVGGAAIGLGLAALAGAAWLAIRRRRFTTG